MSFLVAEEWIEAGSGSFVLVPAEVLHSFENRTGSRAGFLNISVPGDFEANMPGIADWFSQRSSDDADC